MAKPKIKIGAFALILIVQTLFISSLALDKNDSELQYLL